jgi:hypothetical protein
MGRELSMSLAFRPGPMQERPLRALRGLAHRA